KNPSGKRPARPADETACCTGCSSNKRADTRASPPSSASGARSPTARCGARARRRRVCFAAAALGVAVIPASPSGHLPEKILSLGKVAAAGDKAFLAKLRRSGLQVSREIPWSAAAGLSLPRELREERARFTRTRLLRSEPILGSFTSGSTGEPALLFRSVEVLFRRARLGAAAWGVGARDVLLSTGPFTSGVNAVYNLVAPVLVGCSVAVLEKFARRQAVEAIARHRVTRIF